METSLVANTVQQILFDIIDNVSSKCAILDYSTKKTNIFFSQLHKEIGLQKKTYEKAFNEWQQMMLSEKMSHLKLELNETWDDLNQMLEKKTHYMDKLMDMYKLAENQYEQNISSHFNLLDHFMEIHKFFINSYKSLYETRANQMITEFYNECCIRTDIDDNQKTNYKNVKDALSLSIENFMKQQTEIFEEKKIANDIKATIRNEQLVDLNDQKMIQINEQTVEIVRYLKDKFKENKKEMHYMKMLTQTEHDLKVIEMTEQQLFEDQKIYKRLKMNLVEQEMINQAILSALRDDHKILLEKVNRVRQQNELSDLKTKKQLEILVTETHNVTKTLKDQLKLCQKIVGLFEICKKMQTENDFIHFNKEIDQMNTENLHENAFVMEGFWHLVGSVEKDNIVLGAKLKLLQTDNHKLRHQIQTYCSKRKCAKNNI